MAESDKLIRNEAEAIECLKSNNPTSGYVMKENVCITCEYYEKCNKPEREIKCMGYKEKEKENE